jgi:phage terminase large subunit-like protein
VNGVYFDQSSVDRVLAFVRLLTLTKCTASGRPEPFEPLPWFQKLITNVYGWRKPDGTRLIRKVFASMARKNAKTQCIAALSLVELFGLDSEEPQPEVYMAAKSVEQAGYCYSAARDMILADPDLESVCRITPSTKTIVNTLNGGVLKVLSAEGKSKHGSNPSCVVSDELHAWGAPEQELRDALTSGSIARRQPLFLDITTAGTNIETICGREYQYAKRILDGAAEDPTYFPLIYELPKEADWTDEANWPLANPGLGVTVRIDSLRDEVKTALARPSEQNKIRRLNFNQWTEASEIWIPPLEWDKCQGEEWPDLSRVDCYAGLDLSLTRDLTALALVWPVGDEVWCKLHYWIPGEGIDERSRRDGVRYDMWIREGWVEATPGPVVDHAYVLQRILQVAEEHGAVTIAYDRWGAQEVRRACEDAGLPVGEWGQGYRDMNAPTQQLENRVFGRTIHHDGNPVTRWNFSCCSKVEDPAQNMKPVKAKGSNSSQRIDGVVALIMALGVASLHVDTSVGVRSAG